MELENPASISPFPAGDLSGLRFTRQDCPILLQELEGKILEVLEEFSRGNPVDLGRPLNLACRLFPDLPAYLSPEAVTIPDDTDLTRFITAVNRGIFIPHGSVLGVSFLSFGTRVFRADIIPESVSRSSYLGAEIFESSGRISEAGEVAGSAHVENLTVLDGPALDGGSVDFLETVLETDEEERSAAIRDFAREFERLELDWDRYEREVYWTKALFTERAFVQNYAFTQLVQKDEAADTGVHPRLLLRPDSAMVPAIERLNPDSFRDLDFALDRYAGRLRGLILAIDHYFELSQPEMAAFAFIDHMADCWMGANREKVHALAELTARSDRAFFGALYDLGRGNIPNLISMITEADGAEQKGAAARTIVNSMYIRDFLSEEEREALVEKKGR